MDKITFLKSLVKEGYDADMAEGIPTVHIMQSKEAVKTIKKLVKDAGYDSSFAIRFDGGSVPEKELPVSDPEEEVDEFATDKSVENPDATNSPQEDEQLLDEQIEKAPASPREDISSLEPSFDIFSQSFWSDDL